MSNVWICLGETDEFHPFCPFASRDEEEARRHAEYPGHWCVEHPEDDLSKMQEDELKRKEK